MKENKEVEEMIRILRRYELSVLGLVLIPLITVIFILIAIAFGFNNSWSFLFLVFAAVTVISFSPIRRFKADCLELIKLRPEE